MVFILQMLRLFKSSLKLAVDDYHLTVFVVLCEKWTSELLVGNAADLFCIQSFLKLIC